MTRSRPNGLVVLLGAGPGDVALLTVAGLDLLSQAEVVIYDRLAPSDLLSAAPATARRIYAGKGRDGKAMTQERINALMVDLARDGKLVVRLKGGDPFIFGRGGEEAEALRAAGIRFHVVPGITAGAAGAAYAGIPLTDRRYAGSVVLVTGQEDPNREHTKVDYTAVAGIDTIVFYMGVKNLPQIAAKLIYAGKPADTPVAIIERATTARQRTIRGTLATIADLAREQNVAPPALIVVGDVVRLADTLAWRARLPLTGSTVIVTRARRQTSRLSNRLRQLGAEVIEAPAIEIRPVDDWAAVDAALRQIERYDAIAFTSVNGVESFAERMASLGLDARALHAAAIAAVGPATAEALRERFLEPDLVAETFTGEALAVALTRSCSLEGRRVLLARADIAGETLPTALRAAGAEVDDLAVYRTVPPKSLPVAATEALDEGRVDWITFTSSSTVSNFLTLAGPLDESTRLASIGPVTTRALADHGLTATVEADPHTIDRLADAIAEAAATEGRP